MRFRSQLPLPDLFTSVGILLLGATHAASSLACPRGPDAARDLSIQVVPGVRHQIYAAYYKEPEGKGTCSATLEVPLSSFPTTRLATRPAQVAAALREVVEEWGLEKCTINVWYENDTQEELAQHELCLIEEFSFDKGAYWSTSAERPCWEPSEFEIETTLEPINDIETNTTT